MKRVQVQLDDNVATALKAYAAIFEKTVSEVIADSISISMQRHYKHCPATKVLMDREGVAPDKRASKNCYGEACFACAHNVGCRTGMYRGTWEMAEKMEKLMSFPSEGFEKVAYEYIQSKLSQKPAKKHGHPIYHKTADTNRSMQSLH